MLLDKVFRKYKGDLVVWNEERQKLTLYILRSSL